MKILDTEVSPWLIGGALVATGIVVVVATRNKKPSTSEGSGGGSTKVSKLPPRGEGGTPSGGWEPGDPCNTGKAGVFGNYDEEGGCQVFWDDAHEDAVLGHAFNIYNEYGSPDFCDDIYEVLHEGTHQEVTILNPEIDAIVRESLARTYGLPASSWNPEHTGYFNKLPYVMQFSYKLARWVILRELCNFESVI